MRERIATGAMSLSSAADETGSAEVRAVRQIKMLNQLAIDTDYAHGDLSQALKVIVRLLPPAFKAARASIWKVKEDGSVINCIAVADYDQPPHLPVQLPADLTCHAYISALVDKTVIAAENAGSQKSFDDLNEYYHKPEGIFASLDAAIVVNGRLVGVVKIEHRHSSREWQNDEIAFARTVASMAAHVFCRHNYMLNTASMLEAKLAAEKASEAKSQFLASMSHEIRTPMNGVLGIADLLANTCNDDKQRKMVALLMQSGKRMMTVINEILDISRIEAGKMTLCKEIINIREVIFSVLAPLSIEAQRKDLPLDIYCSPDIPELLIGDQVRIAQILINLVGNAIKFTETGNISVLCNLVESKNGYARVRFEVSDTGIGIAQNQLQQLFEPFYQVDRTVSRVIGGAGLGLAISRRLANLMGGSLGINSVESKGTSLTFELNLEIAEVEVSDSSTEIDRNDEGHNVHARVLVVEDDKVSSYLAVSIIEELGLKADSATNGKEAISKLKECKYDMILMDCCMPEMDGFEASRLIRHGAAGEESANIPIIALTACAMRGDQEKCLASGMNGYISKPVEFLQIAALIKGCLSSKNAPVAAAKLRKPII